MRIKLISLISIFLISSGVLSQSEPVKKSKSGICHKPGSSYYQQTKNFTPYKTLDDCLKSGGRLPKR